MRAPQIQTEAFPLQGGLDLVSPALNLAAGNLIDSVNFEPDVNGGYRRMYGFERIDGHPAPSAADYWNVVCTITGTIASGNTITGGSSGKTAVVLQVNGTTELIVTKLSGAFTPGETMLVSAISQGTFTSSSLNAGTTPLLHATYKSLAANNYRADIAVVPGSGPVRGVWYFNGTRYAFRDNAGATAGVMFKESASGWTSVALGTEIQFTTATAQINDGDAIVGGTSAATAIVRRAMLRTGTWSAAGAGTLVIDTITGTWQSGEAIKVGGSSKATSSSLATSITLSPGGRYEFVNNNFAGTTATYRMYGCDGVNYAFEFDGTYYCPIRTGITPDAPKYIATWKNMLLVNVVSSVQASGIGQPFSWTALTGAAELAIGETCSGILPQIGNATSGACIVTTNRNTYTLYGNSSADFRLVLTNPGSGASDYSVQNIGYGYWLDTKGITSAQATLNYGNFEMSVLSRKIQPIIDAKRGLAKGSCIVRATNQYRVFFSDGTGLILYMQGNDSSGNPIIVMLPFAYSTSIYFNTVCSIVDTSGIEHIYASGSDGYAYELEKGTSFDGANIQAHFLTSFNSSKSPRLLKSYLRAVISATAQNTAQVSIGYDLSYAEQGITPGVPVSLTGVGGGGYWDQFTWDQFSWDAPYVNDYDVDVTGDGKNLSLLVAGDSAIDQPYTIHAAILHYINRRLAR